ncbi:hypothetical protein I7I51_07230 [Histoplasma capsulatum]|uniref:Uncharacterized protein n=1 Tax=Ajellomyces capsulatus TaxID=5037 RepID=A0A8A1MP19_AJECA|nr:hypothetical protein I7I51_07230 [Histoplasma capsulatum]
MEKSQSFLSKIDQDAENLELSLLPQEHINSVQKRTFLSRLYLFAVKITLTLLVALTIYTHFSSSPSSPSPYTGSLRTIPHVEVQRSLSAFEVPCGNSPAEARQRGCIFDMIAFNWAHHDFWDEDLHNQFLARGRKGVRGRYPMWLEKPQISDEWSPLFLYVKQFTLDLMDAGKYARKTIMVTAKMGYLACGTEMK